MDNKSHSSWLILAILIAFSLRLVDIRMGLTKNAGFSYRMMAERRSIQNAADAAALAGADALALGRGSAAAVRAARSAASLNHARLVSCSCAGDSAEVVVRLERAHGHARAVVDFSGVPRLGP